MQTFVRLIIILVMCHVAAPLFAQPVATMNRRFVEMPIGPDWDDARTYGIPGATWGSGIAVGFDSGHHGAEFDVHIPQWHVRNYKPHRFQYMGPSYGWEQQGHAYESAETTRHRSIDFMAFHRTNTPVNRYVTVTGLIGGGFVDRPEQFSSVTTELLPDGARIEVNRSEDTKWRNYLAVGARLDVECRISPRLFVVPRIRFTAYPSIIDDSGLAPRFLTARPEISVRWTF